MEYILFCAREANFDTRSILIPFDLFVEARGQDLDLLRNHAQHDIEYKGHIIDNLLVENVTWNNGIGVHDTQPFTKVVEDLIRYTVICPGCDYIEECDRDWFKEAICNVTTGSDHVANYADMRSKSTYGGSPINIVEGYLVLQSDDGTLA